MPQKNIFEELSAEEIAKAVKKHASESRNEEDLKIRVETLLRSKVLDKWGIRPASYEHRNVISGERKDALYGTVIIEYKEPQKLQNKIEFEKAKEQVKKYIAGEAKEKSAYSKYFGVVLDGYNIAFVRFRKNEWIDSGLQDINAQTVLRLLEAIRGLKNKPIDSELLLLDFGPRSETSRKAILILYKKVQRSKSERTKMLFNDWKRVFSQVCAYSPEKLSSLTDYYEIEEKDVDGEKLLFAVHTYYTILMKLLTSEIVTLFADSIIGSYLKRLEDAYYKGLDELANELNELEEGGIFSTVGIRNFLEADYFAWYLDEWDKETAGIVMEIVKKLLDYEPATVELDPDRVKDLFKRLYQNLVPRKVRHDLGEYFTPDWLAELLLNEVGYDGNPDRRVLDPACGSGTFLVLTIKRIKDYAEEHFLSKNETAEKILKNVVGFDLNPLAVLASRANYIIALGELIRYRPREGIEIPIYLADSVLVTRKATLYGGRDYVLTTSEGDFWIPVDIVKKDLLPALLSSIDQFVKLRYEKEDFQKLLAKEKHELSEEVVNALGRLYEKILRLEEKNRNRIWTRLLKNSFAPLLVGKFDYVVGNPPWVNWANLPTHYRKWTKEIWDLYGLTEASEVKRDVAMLFVARCFEKYLENGGLAFLIPFTTYKTPAGAGFRKYLATKCKVFKIHDVAELYPFEGAVNRTSLLVIGNGQTKFPIPCLMWSNTKSTGIDQGEELSNVRKMTRQNEMLLAPILEGKSESPWMIISHNAYNAVKKAIRPSQYKAHSGVDTNLNGVYWIEVLSKEPSGILVRNLSDIGKKQLKEITRVVEKEVVYPLLKGEDVKKWFGVPSSYIVVPHDPKIGKPLSESKIKNECPKAFGFLVEFKNALQNRSTHRLWGKGNPFYAVYKISGYTFSPYKVVWKYIAGKISSRGEFSVGVVGQASDPLLGIKPIVPNNNVMLIPTTEATEAFFIAAVLNSTISRLIVNSYTTIGISTHVLEHVYVPQFNPTNLLHVELSKLSKKAYELAKKYHKHGDAVTQEALRKVEDEIDATVAQLYGITDEELAEIKKTLSILKTGEAKEEGEEGEEPEKRAKRKKS